MSNTAFRPPTQTKYELKPNGNDHIMGPLYKMIIKEQNGSVYEAKDLEDLKSSIFWLDTKTQKKIPALFIDNKNCKSGFVILYSHGNSTDLGRMFRPLQELSLALNINVLAYEYNGYGPTKGGTGEFEVIFGICAAYEFLTQQLEYKWNNIVLYGRSIGSGPSIYLASHPNYPVAGVILHSPIASGLRVFKFDVGKTDTRDLFPNCDYIEHVKAHVFIIHGNADREVSVEHGKLLASRCKNLFSPWWVPDGTHNDIDYTNKKAYFIRISKFLKYVRDFNLDKNIQDLDEFYRVTPWWHLSKHIYIKKAAKIEERYRRYLLKNGKKSMRDRSYRSASASSQRSLRVDMLGDQKGESPFEEHKYIDQFSERKSAYLPPRGPSKSFSFRPQAKAIEVEFNSCSVSSRGQELEMEATPKNTPKHLKEDNSTNENVTTNHYANNMIETDLR